MKFFVRLPTKTDVSTLVDKVVRPIKAGGLGMVKLQDMNHSLWATGWWWLGKDWDALCRRVEALKNWAEDMRSGWERCQRCI